MLPEARSAAEVYEQLLLRSGEATPRPRIEPVVRLAQLLGDPQSSFPVIHVAGTNGKTSTSRAIEIILRAHGLRTGLFTSPHLLSFHERIRIDGLEISDADLIDAWQEMQLPLQVLDAELAAKGQSAITFFEALVVLGFVAFADAPIDVAVIEVGMGGEWDATNIVQPEIVVFTPIALDHTKFLGETLPEIAATKAGIIKEGAVALSAKQPAEVEAVIRDAAAAKDVPLFVEGDEFELKNDRGAVGGRVFDARGIAKSEYKDVLLPLFGQHQSQNALLAIAVVEAYFGNSRPISAEVLGDALAAFTSPGRLQVVSTAPLVLIDAAHNPHGAKQLVAALQEHFVYDELALVLGIFDDKDAAGLVEILAPLAKKTYVTAINSSRSNAPEQIAGLVRKTGAEPDEFDNSHEALLEAYSWAAEAEGRIVLVAGSVMLAGEAIETATREGWST